MKKIQTKPAKNNRNSKKVKSKRNWLKLGYFGLAGFLAISSTSYGIVNRFQEESASAGTNVFARKSIDIGMYWTVYGCRTPNTAFPVSGFIYLYNMSSRRAHLYVNGVYKGSADPYRHSPSIPFTNSSYLQIRDGINTFGTMGSNLTNNNFCY